MEPKTKIKKMDKRTIQNREKLKRKLISIFVPIIGLCLFFLILFPSSFFSDDPQQSTTTMLDVRKMNSTAKTKKTEKNKIITSNEPKYNRERFKNQIVASSFITKGSPSKILYINASWVSDFMSSSFYGGFFYSSYVQLKGMNMPSIIVDTTTMISAQDKFHKILMNSLYTYISNPESKAMWYLGVTENAFVNINALEYFFDHFLGNSTPEKEKIFQIEYNHRMKSYIVIASRAAVRHIVRFPPTDKNIEKMVQTMNAIAEPINGSAIASGGFEKKSFKYIIKGNFTSIPKCTEKAILISKLPFMFIDHVNDYILVKLNIIKKLGNFAISRTNKSMLTICTE